MHRGTHPGPAHSGDDHSGGGKPPSPPRANVSVRVLIKDLELEVIAGTNGLGQTITNPRIQKPGLALTGYSEQLDSGRLLTLGGTEIDYLNGANPDQIQIATATVIQTKPACIVITRALKAPAALTKACNEHNVALLSSAQVSAAFIHRVKEYLQAKLSPSTTVHGVLVEVHDLGILLTGKSGIGKSEAAIDLVVRGHRLVADDIVSVRRVGPSRIVGSGPPMLGDHMEIRGLGVVDVRALFGVAAVAKSTAIDLILALRQPTAELELDRLGSRTDHYTLLGEELPLRQIPVTPGRNIATIIEVAARDQLLRLSGHNSSLELQNHLRRELARRRIPPTSQDEHSTHEGTK